MSQAMPAAFSTTSASDITGKRLAAKPPPEGVLAAEDGSSAGKRRCGPKANPNGGRRFVSRRSAATLPSRCFCKQTTPLSWVFQTCPCCMIDIRSGWRGCPFGELPLH
jgi:hypothetical protein